MRINFDVDDSWFTEEIVPFSEEVWEWLPGQIASGQDPARKATTADNKIAFLRICEANPELNTLEFDPIAKYPRRVVDGSAEAQGTFPW